VTGERSGRRDADTPRMRGVATFAMVAATVWLGGGIGRGKPRPVWVRVVRATWPLVALLVLAWLSRFASAAGNAGGEGGDMSDQSYMILLAFAQVPLFGIAVLGGLCFRLLARIRAAGSRRKAG
jgi:hypothetical protein